MQWLQNFYLSRLEPLTPLTLLWLLAKQQLSAGKMQHRQVLLAATVLRFSLRMMQARTGIFIR
jgi:hypothetical protein